MRGSWFHAATSASQALSPSLSLSLSLSLSGCDSARAGGASGGGGGALNLDDMLSDLTSNPIAALAPGTGVSGPSASSSASAMLSKRKRGLVTPQSARSRRSSGGGGSTASRGSGTGRRPPVPSAWTVRDYEDDAAASADGDFGGGDDDDDDDAGGGFEHFDGEDAGDGDATMRDAGTEKDAAAAAAAAVVESGDTVPAAGGGQQKPPAAAVVSPEAPGGAAAAAAAAKPRSRFDRLKETNDIAVTAAAEAALRPKKTDAAEKDGAAAAAADGKVNEKAAGGVGSSYMPSLEFQGPQYSLGEAPSVPAGSVPSASSWLQKVGKGWCCFARGTVQVLCVFALGCEQKTTLVESCVLWRAPLRSPCVCVVFLHLLGFARFARDANRSVGGHHQAGLCGDGFPCRTGGGSRLRSPSIFLVANAPATTAVPRCAHIPNAYACLFSLNPPYTPARWHASFFAWIHTAVLHQHAKT